MAGFMETVAWQAGEGGVTRGEIPEDWLQGRAAFGGLTAGAAVRAMEGLLKDPRPLRSALVNFVGPLGVGPALAHPQLLRVGASLTQASAVVKQGDRVGTMVSAVFAGDRATRLPVAPEPAPEADAPETLPALPFMPGITPNFTQHFEYRWAAGAMPFSGAKEGHLRGWIRPKAGGILDAAMVLGLLDAWPPPLWPMADRPIPGSTATWQVNLHQTLTGEAVGWCLYDARVRWSRGGFCDFEGHLWDARGELIGTSRQLFVDFSGK